MAIATKGAKLAKPCSFERDRSSVMTADPNFQHDDDRPRGLTGGDFGPPKNSLNAPAHDERNKSCAIMISRQIAKCYSIQAHPSSRLEP